MVATIAHMKGFVPDDFAVPLTFKGAGFRLEPRGPQHNERDHDAWMSSIDHIRQTPDFPDSSWPTAMSLESNLADLVRHASDFENRSGFTYSILDGDDVIGCRYLLSVAERGRIGELMGPSQPGRDGRRHLAGHLDLALRPTGRSPPSTTASLTRSCLPARLTANFTPIH